MLSVRVLRHLAAAAAILFGVTVITFLLMALTPGDTALAILGDSATPQALAALRQDLGLDLPVWQRYLAWLAQVLQGDLGQSFRSGEPVAKALIERIPVTLQLLLGAQCMALLIAIPAGVFSAYRAGGGFDRTSQAATTALVSMPPFLIGLVLIYLFAVTLGWLPSTGYVRPWDDPVGSLRSLALPVFTLALAECPAYVRLLRSEMVQTLQQNFILLARATGASPLRVLFGHALRPSSLSLVTAVGVNLGRMIGGAVVVEVLFGLPGLGQLLAEAIFQREYLQVQGVVLFVAVAFVAINLCVDLLYVWLDPRVRVHG